MINIVGKMAKFKYNLLGVVYLFLQFLSQKKKKKILQLNSTINLLTNTANIYIYIILLKDD